MLALLGDNGAGKSTLIKCLSGVHRLDSGSIEMDGVPVTIHAPADARALGIETVYQDLALFDNLRPTDNFYAGRELAGPRWAAALAAAPQAQADDRRRRATCSSGCRWRCRDINAPVGLMSGGQRQAVAVSRAAAFASNVVILDEPTAALGVRESRARARPDPAAAEREQGRDRGLARDGSRDGGRRPRRRPAPRPEGRRADPVRRDLHARSSR